MEDFIQTQDYHSKFGIIKIESIVSKVVSEAITM